MAAEKAPIGWIIIPRWDGPDGFQHYKSREPVWIKNYTRLLSNHSYLRLTFRQRGILHGIWLLYAASGRELGSSPAEVGRMLGESSVRVRDLEALSDAGFITLSASKTLAACKQDASPEKEEEEEKTYQYVPLDVEAALRDQPADNGLRQIAEMLGTERFHALEKLLKIVTKGDAGTPRVLASLCKRLPTSKIDDVRIAYQRGAPVGKVVNALKDKKLEYEREVMAA